MLNVISLDELIFKCTSFSVLYDAMKALKKADTFSNLPRRGRSSLKDGLPKKVWSTIVLGMEKMPNAFIKDGQALIKLVRQEKGTGSAL